MRRMTIELIRKRAEHNEGEIQSLEELSLHQEKLEKIENLDKWCRGLKILLLQNNNINKIENLSRLKHLEYVNLALNNIEIIEGLEGCESLKKLDLTLNFIGQISSVAVLRKNLFLEQLHLTGNPCTDFSGYRQYVLAKLPHINVLDGIEIIRSERIKAKQDVTHMDHLVKKFEEDHKNKREIEKKKSQNEDFEGDDFWSRPSENTPEARAQMQKRLELDDEKKCSPRDKRTEKKVSKVRTFFLDNGRPLNINEGKYSFSLLEDLEKGTVILELDLPKFMDSSLVHADVQPNYVRVTVKGKIFQLCLPDEVCPDKSIAQRSRVNGHLVITMPKYDQEKIIEIWRKSKPKQNIESSSTEKVVTNEKPKEKDCLEPETTTGINESCGESAGFKEIVQTRSSDLLFPDDEVPPLI